MNAPSTRPLDASGFAIMLLISVSLAFQQIPIKLTLADVGPLWQSAIRSAGAAAMVAAMIALSRGPRWMPGHAVNGVLAGLLFALEFWLLYQALALTDVARAVLMLYTAPFFVALGGHFVLRTERLGWAAWLGIAMAFAGTGLVLGPSKAAQPDAWIGDLMAVGAGLAWALTTILIRGTRLIQAPPLQLLQYQLIVSALVLGASAWAQGDRLAWPSMPLTWFSLAYQSFWAASVCFALWFVLIRRYSATRVSVFTFMTPLFGVAFGIVLLGERLLPAQWLALPLVIAGLWLVNRPARG